MSRSFGEQEMLWEHEPIGECFNMKDHVYEDMIEFKAIVKLKPEIKSGLNGIRTHVICDTSAVLYLSNYRAIWELVTL